MSNPLTPEEVAAKLNLLAKPKGSAYDRARAKGWSVDAGLMRVSSDLDGLAASNNIRALNRLHNDLLNEGN